MKRQIKRFYLDWTLLLPYLILCITGIILVYSASSYQLLFSEVSTGSKGWKQLSSFAVSLVCLLGVYRMKLKIFRSKGFLFLLLTSNLILLVYTLSKGINAGGASRWINVGFMIFQPSELVSLTLLLYLSRITSNREANCPFSFSYYKKAMLLCFLFIVLVSLQPNLAGGAMIFLFVLIMLLASGLSPYFTILPIIGFIGIREGLSRVLLSGSVDWLPDKFAYLVTRFKVMENPFIDPTGIGHQSASAYYAMYNGGIFGRGIGKGIQKQGFLPASDTDYIFATAIEELGLIGGVVLLLLVFFMVIRLYQLSIRSKNLYYSQLFLGCGTILLLQVTVNVSSLLGYIPLTGVTFPFLSYGGSSLLILSIVLGLALNARATELREPITVEQREE
ncbi:FtsW/RodA/SpoVE family cell cycle protein [Enterococcus larvae]|uniref:FtsW/RodA/SpoVE family cell cycle protein n=1 Tax=Enterococcus larvae TaxID=2794352 RepID=UPI003F310351